ncbi:hypothetical protein FHS43_003383 [Streptosporangium becharense]|uniref:Uncharacterized protein n=1 Tax=Streptosporangium becharense TaxID=1816182 RepID=A0A7W9MFC7_9ACTN|nr:hypothetical protein [Streptosporangium becharense]MBB5818650.1 hypothetical protein [Streptosporangium becharense]
MSEITLNTVPAFLGTRGCRRPGLPSPLPGNAGSGAVPVPGEGGGARRLRGAPLHAGRDGARRRAAAL